MGKTTLRHIVVLLLVPLAVSWCGAQTAGQRLERDADRLPMLLLDARLNFQGWILDDLEFHETPRKARLLHEQIFKELIEADLPVKELLPVLKHENPKVRTLALIALVNKEDPSVLPDIHALIKDAAPTFGKPPSDHSAVPAGGALREKNRPEPANMPKLLPQTVGDVASLAIQMFVKQTRAADFDTYWAERKDRAACATWFLVRVERANQLLDHTRNRTARLKAVRQDVDRLPADDRAWTLLWLAGRVGTEDGLIVTEKELLALCKALGDAKLLKLLAFEKISDDPDLQPATGANASMVGFVLDHAKELLTRDAGAPLLDVADTLAKDGTPYRWYLAAAELQPEKAGEITKVAAANLKAAFKTHRRRDDLSERMQWAQALWTVAGAAEAKFLLEWFYTEKETPSYNPHSSFISHVGGARPKENRALLAQLVRDPRFHQLDWVAIDQLIRVVNPLVKKPVVSERELDDLRGPGGMIRAQWLGRKEIVDDLRRRHPEELARLLQTLDQWRQKVRASVLEWEP